ncbi:methyltransferase [Candidatus Viridilinea mediisalina]|uniref:Methyltransferase small domain-containing protein n=1 Tax=Candidatus Viridilinea mediisalina TaxID=2024553 RepID=A0A2A6RPZ5_9CHLR|nr:methyltransferase [Candidatus Viridilinea mediisalina]PDW04948.1 hypothetical protein CJ255_00790 [Candidatus Viridilinea mediisalina]
MSIHPNPLHIADTTVLLVGQPGVPAGPTLDPASRLAAELIRPAPHERVLLLGAAHPALGVVLAQRLPAGHLVLSDPHVLVRRMASLTLATNACTNTEVADAVSLLPQAAGTFDRVIILGPRSRALARRWLVEAQVLLRPTGILNLAGANQAGIQSLISDAKALFGTSQMLGYGGSCRVAALTQANPLPPAPPWASLGGIAPGTWHTLQLELPDGPLHLVSLPGSFSYEHLDPGTKLLLRQLGPLAGLNVLDVGCGYGVLGIAAARQGAAHVTMLDVCQLALAAAHENCARLGLQNVSIYASNGLEAVSSATTPRFDLILSNPPFHSGRTIDRSLATTFFGNARSVLQPQGRLLLVANSFLNYETLLAANFARVVVAQRTPSYKVLLAE